MFCRSFTVCGGIMVCVAFFFLNETATTEIYTLALHDALPILAIVVEITERMQAEARRDALVQLTEVRSEEHTSELQSHHELVCRLLLEKNNAQAAECGDISEVFYENRALFYNDMAGACNGIDKDVVADLVFCNDSATN